MVALPPFGQAGPPAEGLHHLTAPSGQRCVSCRAAVVMPVLSMAAPTQALAGLSIMQLTKHLARNDQCKNRRWKHSSTTFVGDDEHAFIWPSEDDCDQETDPCTNRASSEFAGARDQTWDPQLNEVQ